MKMQWSVENFGVGKGGLESLAGGQRGILPRGSVWNWESDCGAQEQNGYGADGEGTVVRVPGSLGWERPQGV